MPFSGEAQALNGKSSLGRRRLKSDAVAACAAEPIAVSKDCRRQAAVPFCNARAAENASVFRTVGEPSEAVDGLLTNGDKIGDNISDNTFSVKVEKSPRLLASVALGGTQEEVARVATCPAGSSGGNALACH